MIQKRHESILRAVNNTSGKYNILTAPTHERYQSNWKSLPHTFYMFQKAGVIKPWNFKFGQIPDNHILLDGSEYQIKADQRFDIVLAQNRFGQLQILTPIARQLGLPIINIEHTLPVPSWTEKQKQAMAQLRGDINIFISSYSAKKWLFDLEDPSVRIIHHGVDTDIFKQNVDIEKKPHCLSICNDLINRDWACGYYKWQEITDGFNRIIRGDTQGLSTPCKNIEELVFEYSQAICFVNSSLVSPIPTVVLEAMSCGLPIITLDNCMLPEVVENEYSGYISNDIVYLREKLKYLLDNPSIAHKMGQNARKTIIEKFSLDKHLSSWIKIFDELYGKVF